jgi:uncharacterized protein YodC (DUF2158 family)
MIEGAQLRAGHVVRLASGSIKFCVERIDSAGVHLVGWGDRTGVVHTTARPECLVWPRPVDEAHAPIEVAA